MTVVGEAEMVSYCHRLDIPGIAGLHTFGGLQQEAASRSVPHRRALGELEKHMETVTEDSPVSVTRRSTRRATASCLCARAAGLVHALSKGLASRSHDVCALKAP